jgi:putative ABC transport system ATP-binding protein
MAPRPVWQDIELSLYKGERMVLMGRSGSGKSTLLNCLYGLEPPTQGHVYFYPPVPVASQDISTCYDLYALSEWQQCLLRQRHYGYIFQMFHLLPTMTVLENVLLPLELLADTHDHEASIWKRPAQRIEAARAMLDAVGLSHRIHHMATNLSGGEMQRVAIARALVHEPALVFADEPTGNLDAQAAEDVLALLLTLSQNTGTTLLMVTHSEEVASVMATRRFRLVPDAHSGICQFVADEATCHA